MIETMSGLIFNYVFDRNFIYQLGATFVVHNLIIILIYMRVRQRRYKLFKYYGIAHPPTNIWDGNFGSYRRDPALHKTNEEFKTKYGKTFGIFIGDDPEIMTTDLELIREVFLENGQSFAKRFEPFIDTPLNASILLAAFPRWKVMRNIVAPLFNTYKMRGTKTVQFVEDNLSLMLEYIENKFIAKSNKIRLDIQSLMKATALRIISDMALNLPGVEVKEREEHVRAMDEFLGRAGDGAVLLVIRYPFLKSPIEFFARHFEYGTALKMINKSLNSTIDSKLGRLKKRKTAAATLPNLMDVLVKSHYEKLMSREEVISNCFGFLAAGYDTTSTTMTYVFWVLAKYPKIQEKLRSELITYGTESQYLSQVIEETMRLYPTVMTFTSRLATETVDLGNMIIPKGTRVIYNAWLVHRDPEIWPEPEKFDPDRFKPGVERHPCAYAPFGLGARKCLGLQLAMLEMRMLACDIILRYKLSLVAPTELELISHTNVLSKPREAVILELTKF